MTDKPKLWRDMTPEEKGALLLAHYEGNTLEYFDGKEWQAGAGVFGHYYAYRIRPEPKRETVTLHYGLTEDATMYQTTQDTHRITFDLIDGKPDPASIRMEEL